MSSAQTKLLSVVLPCYNPPDNIYPFIISQFALVKRIYPDTELILVNDGSAKNFTLTAAQSFFSGQPDIQVVSYPENKGKGHALREGVKAAKGAWIIYTDIDFPYTEESFAKILNTLQAGQCDVAIGIRPEEYYTHLPKARVRISKFLRFLIRSFLKIPTDDTQCGLKGFNTTGKAIFLQTTIERYLFDLEFIFIASRKKVVLKTVEVDLKPEVVLSQMRLNILIQELGNFLKIFAKSFFKYGI